tara:strand:+ start:2387 stop:3490 length:1104 start_codon:yes stop_codon:yes gene_type:complete
MTAHFHTADTPRHPTDASASSGLAADIQPAKPTGAALTQQQANDVFALYSQGRYQEALDKTRALIALHYNLPLLHNLAGAIHKALGQSHQAIGSFRRAIALQPERAEAHNNLGEALSRIGRHEEAITCLAQAMSIKPDFAEAHHNLGVALAALGRHREAIGSFRRAIALRPRHAAALNGLGEALILCGEPEEAEENFQAAIVAKPDFVAAHANLGRVLTELGRAREAAEACHRALALDSDHIPGFLHLAAALDWLGETYAATACIDHVIKRQPANVEAHEVLCTILERRGRADDLRKALSRARRQCGETDPRIQFRIAQQAHGDGDTATADRFLGKLCEEDKSARLAKARSCLFDAIARRAGARDAE